MIVGTVCFKIIERLSNKFGILEYSLRLESEQPTDRGVDREVSLPKSMTVLELDTWLPL